MGKRSFAAVFAASALVVFTVLRTQCAQQPAAAGESTSALFTKGGASRFTTGAFSGGSRGAAAVAAAAPTSLPQQHTTAEAVALPRLPAFMMPPHCIAVITAAQLANATLQLGRDPEYARSLPFFFEHFQSVYAVTSGVTPWPLLDAFQFTRKLHFSSGLKSKSAQESEALRALARELNSSLAAQFPGGTDHVIVFKASGRYQVVRDEVLRIVRDTADAFDIWYLPFGNWFVREGQLMFDPGDNLAMTFFIAMRWALFRDFYAGVDLENLNSGGPFHDGYDVERAIVDFVKERRLRVHHLKHLHVVANIGDGGVLRYF